MNNPAINPAATCPDWCVSTHTHDWLVTRPTGEWNALHEGREDVVYTDETVAPGLVNNITVRSEAYLCETGRSCYPRSVAVSVVSTYGQTDNFTLTPRQALRLAEVLVQQASLVLAAQGAALEVTR